jgi:RNA ligase (TIGR02306 family)
MRRLATIEKVEEILPIPEADFIEICGIKGWHCVVKKGEVKVGDPVLYCEIDSFLPVRPEFEFLSKGSKPKKMIYEGKEIEGFRLKTKRLKNQISQGLVLPVSTFPELNNPEIGTDVTELLNIHLYEAPIPPQLQGTAKGCFPGFIPKTDEERIQDCAGIIEQYKGERFTVTEKIDGTSVTVFQFVSFGVCCRKLELIETEGNTYWKMANKYNLKETLPEGFAIQGEIVGEGIQSNRLKLKGQDLYVFYVYEIKERRYLKLDEMVAFCNKLGLKTVPIYDDRFVMSMTCEKLLELANGKSMLNSNCSREGLVFRLYEDGLYHRKISFKAISNQYLLEHGI